MTKKAILPYTLLKDEKVSFLEHPDDRKGIDVSLDDILGRQLLALSRVTRQLLGRSTSCDMTKGEIESLASCIEITLKLKAKEKDLLDSMSTEELEKIAKGT